MSKFFQLASSDKIYETKVYLHELESEILRDYTGDCELNRSMFIGPVEYKTNIRFRKIDDFENYKIAIHIDYNTEDVTFFWVYSYIKKNWIPSCQTKRLR